jgi:hypothetical protein
MFAFFNYDRILKNPKNTQHTLVKNQVVRSLIDFIVEAYN